MIKICTQCHEEVSFEEFPKIPKGDKHGLSAWCRNCHREYARRRRKNNPEVVKDIQKRHYEKVKQNGGWQNVYKESFKKAQKKYEMSEKGRINRRIIQHNYRTSQKGKEISKRHRLRRKEMKSYSSFSVEQWNLLVLHYCPDGKCLRCKKKRKLTIDHVIPLIRDGSNSIDNIQPLCGRCNSSKNSSSIDYRYDKGHFALSLME